MRCRACNEVLSDYENTIRSIYTREYIGLCKYCLDSVKSEVVGVGNISLMSELDDIGESLGDTDDPFEADRHNDDYYDR